MDITKYLAIYAALLSTAVFMWNVSRARPKFKVKMTLGMEKIEDEYVSGAYIALQNPSAHTVHISAVDILYRYRRESLLDRVKHAWEFKRIMLRVGWVHYPLSMHGVETGLPISLEAGKSHMIFISDEKLDEIIEDALDRRIIASAQDALWRTKYSAKFDYPKMVRKDDPAQIEQKEAAPEDAA
ncbi:hypothetical protein ACSSNL_15345 [Thalassobius sp. S69A]|uniref:hypothetical protein n=1 Tax=unclassified Thalassovita TaxID=2619711 RepID=UPI003C7EC793